MTLTVYIGTEDDQLIPQKVLEYSIHKNARRPVQVRAVKQEIERVGGTNFGFVRFLVPKLNGYQGKAIYLDADQLVFTDINELADSLDDDHSIALVKEPKGTFGAKAVGQHNQTSVMAMECAKLRDWNPDTMFQNVVPNRAELGEGQIHYRDFMMLTWFDQDRIQPIDPRWNHFNIVEPDSKLTHFSYVRSQPWKNPGHPLTAFWGKWLREAVRAGAVGRLELIKEIWRGAIHKHFLAYLL
ncbi:hypothetical protein J5J83_07825 [Azoarcus sp. L1K30]|uniref:glycosyltransferase n=1 Tax=Azoarcus sp. L1K30 TaxID=2820277 RepID=UPI001B81EC77|nr:glycosyltransferase [Azoarcus sp. L1K30]MBR0566020.1 hypothetical protein [Azoarcus sp. L1K30]